jgi:hypothetical protein
MNTYKVTFETIMVASNPTVAAERVSEGLENGDYQRSVFYVSDVNTDEQSVEIEIGAEAAREEAEALEEGRVEHMVHMEEEYREGYEDRGST